MLDALRSGDVKKLAQYEDITPINAQDYIAAQAARIAVTIPEFSKDYQLSLEEQAVFKLLELDIPSKVARSSVRKVISKSAVGQPLSAVVQKAFKLALNMDAENTQAQSDPQAEDLRNTLGGNPYDGFKKGGGIVAVADEFWKGYCFFQRHTRMKYYIVCLAATMSVAAYQAQGRQI